MRWHSMQTMCADRMPRFPGTIDRLLSRRYRFLFLEIFVLRDLLVIGLMCCFVAASPSAGSANGQGSQQAVMAAGDADRTWIGRSNEFANLLIDIEKKHSPERASADGLSQY